MIMMIVILILELLFYSWQNIFTFTNSFFLWSFPWSGNSAVLLRADLTSINREAGSVTTDPIKGSRPVTYEYPTSNYMKKNLSMYLSSIYGLINQSTYLCLRTCEVGISKAQNSFFGYPFSQGLLEWIGGIIFLTSERYNHTQNLKNQG